MDVRKLDHWPTLFAILFSVTQLAVADTVTVSIIAPIDNAEIIFRGTVLETEYGPGPSGVPFSYYTVHVSDVLKGEVADDTLVIRMMGGAGEMGIVLVSTIVHLAKGREYLLCVSGNGTWGNPVLDDGMFTIVRSVVSGDQLLFDSSSHQVTHISDNGDVHRTLREVERPGRGEPDELGLIAVDENEEYDAEVPVSQEFSHPQPGDKGAGRDNKAHNVDSLVDELKTLIEKRSTEPSFKPGKQVMSAPRWQSPNP